jgi:hypothetical protein
MGKMGDALKPILRLHPSKTKDTSSGLSPDSFINSLNFSRFALTLSMPSWFSLTDRLAIKSLLSSN